MGRSITKMMMMVLVLTQVLLISSSSGLAVKKPNANGEGGRYSPYESEEKITPKSADSDSKVFHGNTCCSAVKGYLGLFELLECLICDLNVGIQSDTYFSSNASNQSVVQCGENEGVICGKASKWESNGTFVTTDDSVYEPSLEPVVESLKFGLIFLRWSSQLLILVVILRLARALARDVNKNA